MLLRLKPSQSLVLTRFGFTVELVHAGTGRHILDLQPSQMEPWLRNRWIYDILNAPTLFLVKLSVVLFLFRIGGLSVWLKISLIALVAIQCLAVLVWMIIMCLRCRPLIAIWKPEVHPNAKCISKSILLNTAYWTSGIISMQYLNDES